MNRIELVEKLERVAPALSGNDLIPILTRFWFSGKEVMTFNDQIAISVPCKTDFEGAVPSTLLELLKASRAKTVEFDDGETDKDLIVRAASSKFNLDIMHPADGFPHKMPKEGKTGVLGVNGKKFIEAIDCCMRSVSIDTSVPDQLGVTLIANGRDLDCYSTDNATLSHASLELKDTKSFTGRVILSSQFCRQMLSLMDKGKALQLEIDDDHALFMGAGGSLLFGKLIASEKPVNFPATLARHFPEGADAKLVSVPTKLELILERACIVAAGSVKPVRTEIEVVKGVAHFATISQRGEVYDSVQLEGKHKDVMIKVDPKLLKNGYGSFDKMLITEACFIMATEDVLYLVGASGT